MARRWKRRVEAVAVRHACDEIFIVVLRNAVAAERAVQRLRDPLGR